MNITWKNLKQMFNKKGTPVETTFKPSVATVEQFIKDNPGITAKEIAWKFEDEPSDSIRTMVAAVAWQLVSRKSNTYQRSKDAKGVMRYYAPGVDAPNAEPPAKRQYKKQPKLTREYVDAHRSPSRETFDEILAKAARPVENVEKRTHQDAPEPSEPAKTVSPTFDQLEQAAMRYVWDTAADPKPLHDFLDWYSTQA